MPSKRVKQAIILVMLLAVPGFLYFLLQEKGKNRFKPLQFYGPKQLSGTYHTKRGRRIPDTLYHSVLFTSISNSSGKPLNAAFGTGKITVLCLFNSQDSVPTALVRRRILKLAQIYQKNGTVVLAPVAVNSNSPDTAFSTARQLKGQNFAVLTADSASLKRFAVHSLLLDLTYTNSNGTLTPHYSNRVVLLDARRRIRGFYELQSDEDMDRLTDEIKLLLAEKGRDVIHMDNI